MFEKLSKHPLITGSFLLTLTGLISRLIGFFYRIYLSRIFGEEGMGIYQLLNPILALSFSLTAAGFQTTISKFVAEENNDNAYPRRIFRPMTIGLSICLPASIVASFLCIQFSDHISMYFLGEPRTASLLRIVALSFPLSTLHACINGYFYGRKKSNGSCTLPDYRTDFPGCKRLPLLYIFPKQRAKCSIKHYGTWTGNRRINIHYHLLCVFPFYYQKPVSGHYQTYTTAYLQKIYVYGITSHC